MIDFYRNEILTGRIQLLKLTLQKNVKDGRKTLGHLREICFFKVD